MQLRIWWRARVPARSGAQSWPIPRSRSPTSASKASNATFGIIYPPQVALVGFGKIAERPWAVSGKVEVRPLVTVDAVRRSSRDRWPSGRHVSGRDRPPASDAGEVMTPEAIKRVVEALARIAPEIDRIHLSGRELPEQLDLDSMDFLNFVLALHDRLGVDIPEADYPHLYSLNSALSYLASKPFANPTVSSAPESSKPASGV